MTKKEIRALEKDFPFGEIYKDPYAFSFSKILCIFSDIVLVASLILAFASVVWYFRWIDAVSFSENYSGITPDLSFLSFLLPSSFALAGLTHTFYYNKERFANVIKIRFEYIKQLLMFKLKSGMYTKEELQSSLDDDISTAEDEMKGVTSSYIAPLEEPLENPCNG